MPEPKMYQHFRARNDVNGNPQRCFLVYDEEGNFYDVIDEGYGGIPKVLRDLVQLPTMEGSVADYRAFLKRSPSGGRFFRAE